ncbi:MAG TPA: hypothetical protein P5556_03805 [Candidatus Gastranaerophilales bacterium]|nr:hypothetical protein [Candidatus Gastranaerophilales bacterium]
MFIKRKNLTNLMLILILFLNSKTSALNLNKDEIVYNNTVYSSKIDKNYMIDEESRLQKLWNVAKGKPSKDAINLGMFSYHTMETRDQLNESNKLLGLDYKGYSVGTFNNSYHVQTYYAGISRQVYEKELPGNNSMQLKYKLIGMHGYERFEPDLFGITPIIIPVLGFDNKYLGVDFLISPGKTLTFATNFRINIDKIPPKKALK